MTTGIDTFQESPKVSQRKTILVAFPPNLQDRLDLRLFKWLSAVFLVEFKTKSAGDPVSFDNVVYLGNPPQSGGQAALSSLTFLSLTEKESTENGTVVFGQDPSIHATLCGRSVDQRLYCGINTVKLDALDAVLASFRGQPIWTTRRTGLARADVTAIPFPAISQNQCFSDYFNKDNFINLLPLVDFVRRVSDEAQWISPRLRACLMFDDPNLHSTSYGFINFRKMAQHAAQWNYHVSFATIPLDGWFSNRQAVQLFVEQKSRMSLLVHGNDHVKNELVSFASNEQAAFSLAQSLRRIARFEEKTNVAISKVMAAPFGACSEETMSVMAQLGFEAACISAGSLRLHNPMCSWSENLGLPMAEIIKGFPVFSRFRLNAQSKNQILLAAYLGQPIVPVGHHQDVANGLDLLADLAQFINSFGEVQWGDLRSLARSNFLVRQDGNLLRIRPYSRRFQVNVPTTVDRVSIEPPEGAFNEENVKITTSQGAKLVFSGPVRSTAAVQPDTELNIILERTDAINPESIPDQGTGIWAITRRQMTEGRDRMQPWFRRAAFWRAF